MYQSASGSQHERYHRTSIDSTLGKRAERSDGISQVIRMITSIAEQTHLPALNATIERGFSNSPVNTPHQIDIAWQPLVPTWQSHSRTAVIFFQKNVHEIPDSQVPMHRTVQQPPRDLLLP